MFCGFILKAIDDFRKRTTFKKDKKCNSTKNKKNSIHHKKNLQQNYKDNTQTVTNTKNKSYNFYDDCIIKNFLFLQKKHLHSHRRSLHQWHLCCDHF